MSTPRTTQPRTTPDRTTPDRRATGRQGPRAVRLAATLGLVLSTGAALGACGQPQAGGGSDIVATGQLLAEKGVCSRLGVQPAPGVVEGGTPEAGLVDRSLQCGDGSTPAVVLSSTRTNADRDALCTALRSDPAVLCGTGDNLWVVRVMGGGTTKVAGVLGSAARAASAS